MAGFSVVGVEHDDVGGRLLQERFPSRAEPPRIPCEKRGAASVQHGLAVRVHVGAGDIARAAYHSAVIAFYSAAAQIERHEQIIEIAVMDDEWRFDGLPIRGQSGGGGGGFSGRSRLASE